MNKIVLGLDIGIASVGWGLIDYDTGEIIDKGVRLFSEASPKNNQERRAKRSTRRMLRRKTFRLQRMKELLKENGYITDDFVPLLNPYEIRCRGLKAKLSKEEFATAILHLTKRNGYRYDVVDSEDEEKGVKLGTKCYVCEDQLKRFIEDRDHKVRANDNKYHFSDYKREVEALLKKQEINDDLAKKINEIAFTRRSFEEGPGSATSPTPYGRFLSYGVEPINLIEKMRGKCSVYPDQLRAPKMSFSAELYNFLNDLNNLNFGKRKITTEEKENIIENIIPNKGGITFKQLASYIGESEENITGYRIDKKEKPIITDFVGLKKIKKALKDNDIDSFEISCDQKLIDSIFEVLTKSKIVEKRIEDLKKIDSKKLTPKIIEILSRIPGVSGYHSLSLKALREMNEEMLEESLNQQQIKKNNNIGEMVEVKTKGGVIQLDDAAILNPVVKRSVNESLKILHAVEKKYGKLYSVMIEMTRSKNSDDEKDKIKESQAKNEARRKQATDLLQGHVDDTTNISGKLITKIMLYQEQNGKSVYSGKPIDLERLIGDSGYCEIDHIIPLSVSCDDSYNNKVLVLASENQIKGQRTPYAVFKDRPAGWQTWDEFTFNVMHNENLSKRETYRKKENLLFTGDISLSKVQKEFIERNIVDTGYSCRYVMNILKRYYSQRDLPTMVDVINGKLTHDFRKRAKYLDKDRSMYCHHAVDALIIASFKRSKFIDKMLMLDRVDIDTGEILGTISDDEAFDPSVIAFAAKLAELNPVLDYKFSYKIDTKPNRSMSAEYIYSARKIDGDYTVIKIYKEIHSLKRKDGETLANLIRSGDEKKIEKLLVYKNDRRTYEILKKVVEAYPNEKNPFNKYKADNNDYVRKYSKKGNGPALINIRYVEDKLNYCIDIGHKLETKPKDKKVVKLQLSPYRMDLYKNKDGKYRFVTIRYPDVLKKGSLSYIDKDNYDSKKKECGISDNAEFIGTFHRGDLIERTFETGEKKLEVFKVVNNPDKQIIEYQYFGQETAKDGKKFRYMATIGKCKDVKKSSNGCSW